MTLTQDLFRSNAQMKKITQRILMKKSSRNRNKNLYKRNILILVCDDHQGNEESLITME